MIYLGCDVNGEECERALGKAFETHLPSRNQIVYRDADGREVVANVGDDLPVWLCGAFSPHKPPWRCARPADHGGEHAVEQDGIRWPRPVARDRSGGPR